MIDNMAVTANRCMDAVRDHVGTVELETFIYYVRSQVFDYTEWQKEHYDSMTSDEIFAKVQEHSNKQPFRGKKANII